MGSECDLGVCAGLADTAVGGGAPACAARVKRTMRSTASGDLVSGLRALEEPGGDQSQRERRSDEDGGLPARQPLRVGEQLSDVFFLQLLRPGVDSIHRLVDISRDRLVFLVAKPLRARADRLRDAAERFDATVFLLRQLRRRALLDAGEDTVVILFNVGSFGAAGAAQRRRAERSR
jgi:hypothetical protein